MLCMVVVACLFGQGAHASSKDLTIAPLRTEKSVSAGSKAVGRFTVSNETDKPMTIELSVKQFSVKNYSYAYVFRNPDNEWLSFENNRVTLPAKSSKEVDYTIAVPAGAAPGGYYFGMMASTTIAGTSIPTTLQLGSLLYLTVDGKVTKAGELQAANIAFLQTGHDIPYVFNVANTGNTHFAADFFAQIDGTDKAEQTHFVLPGTVRQIEGSLRAPLWPGIYTVTYGYQADYMSASITKTVRILYVPLWFIALFGMLAFGGGIWIGRRFLAGKASSSR